MSSITTSSICVGLPKYPATPPFAQQRAFFNLSYHACVLSYTCICGFMCVLMCLFMLHTNCLLGTKDLMNWTNNTIFVYPIFKGVLTSISHDSVIDSLLFRRAFSSYWCGQWHFASWMSNIFQTWMLKCKTQKWSSPLTLIALINMWRACIGINLTPAGIASLPAGEVPHMGHKPASQNSTSCFEAAISCNL